MKGFFATFSLNDTQHNKTECHYAECHIIFIVMLNVIMLNIIMLNVIMLSVINLSVAAPFIVSICGGFLPLLTMLRHNKVSIYR